MRPTFRRGQGGPPSILPAAAALVLAALVVACSGARAVGPDASLPGQSGSRSPAAPPSGAVAPGPAGSTALPESSPLGAGGTLTPAAGATPTPSAPATTLSAPTSPVHFPYRRAVVPLTFPLPASARYAYRRDFLLPRVGRVYAYNHAWSTAPNGTLRRAHDGMDIAVALGTPVRAPFSGTVINPATRWKPWDPARYGKVVVIVSDEPTSPGYSVILAHLSKVSVKVGQHVSRGQLVGKTGNTGNAVGTPPHLHFELRAPFLIRVKEAGTVRRIDAFDPYPSLAAADPHRN